jgi:hypothetical protein
VAVTFFPAINERVPVPDKGRHQNIAGRTIFCPRYFVQKSATPAWEGWDIAVVRLGGTVGLKKYFTVSVTHEAEALKGHTLILTGYTQHNFCEMYSEHDAFTHASIPHNIVQTAHDSSFVCDSKEMSVKVAWSEALMTGSPMRVAS